jgi:hypothetical protein
VFIHIGGDVAIPLKSIIAIMDIDNTTVSKDTREFLKIAEEEGFVESISYELPKTFIITEYKEKSKIYLTHISSVTLLKRAIYMKNIGKNYIRAKMTKDKQEDRDNGHKKRREGKRRIQRRTDPGS